MGGIAGSGRARAGVALEAVIAGLTHYCPEISEQGQLVDDGFTFFVAGGGCQELVERCFFKQVEAEDLQDGV